MSDTPPATQPVRGSETKQYSRVALTPLLELWFMGAARELALVFAAPGVVPTSPSRTAAIRAKRCGSRALLRLSTAPATFMQTSPLWGWNGERCSGVSGTGAWGGALRWKHRRRRRTVRAVLHLHWWCTRAKVLGEERLTQGHSSSRSGGSPC